VLLAILACLPNAADPPEAPRQWGPPPPALRQEATPTGGVGARAVAGVTPLWPYARGTVSSAVSVQGTRVRVRGVRWESVAPGQWRLPLPLVPGLLLNGVRVDDVPCASPAPDCSLSDGRIAVGGVTDTPRRLAFNVPPELALREASIRGRKPEKSALSAVAYRIDDEPEPVVALGEKAVQVTLAQVGNGAVLTFRPRFLRSSLFSGEVPPIPLEVVGTRSGGEPTVVWTGLLDPGLAPAPEGSEAAAADAQRVSVPLDPAVFQAWSMIVLKAAGRPQDALAGVTVLADLAIETGPK
jgi:hypothetical protein